MGGCVPSQVYDKMPVYKVQPQQISTYIEPQYIILLTQNCYYPSEYDKKLKQSFRNLIICKSKNELLEYREDSKNNILIVCCKNREEIRQIRLLPNIHTFNKIGVAFNFHIQNMQQTKLELQKEIGFRFRDIFQDTLAEIKRFFNYGSEGQSLYFCHRNKGMINRAFITFHYLFKNTIKRCLSNGQSSIIGVRLCSEVGDFIILNIFGQDSIFKKVNHILGNVKNVGVLANVSWFCSVIFDFINKKYTKTLQKAKIDQFYIWTKLNKRQIQILQSSQGQSFMFSSFVIGDTDKNYIPPQSDVKDMYRIYVNIPKEIKSFDKQADLGFYVHQNKVIVNLLNLFRVDKVLLQQRSIFTTYCNIGIQNKLRKDKSSQGFRYYRDAKKSNIRMMELYDFYCFNRQNIRDELDLLCSLQMYEIYKKIAPLRLAQIKDNPRPNERQYQGQQSQQQRIKEYLGDCQFQTKNIGKAVEYYEAVQPIERGLLKKLYLYSVTSNGPKLRQSVEQLKAISKRNFANNSNSFVDIAMNNFIADMSSRSGDFDHAQKKIHETFKQMSQVLEKGPKYFRGESYVYPLYEVLHRTFALIAKCKGYLRQSEIMQRECTQNSLIFDGVHKIWLQRQAQSITYTQEPHS